MFFADILECEVKWASGSITTNKTSGGNGISAELFQILKDDAVKVLALNMPANLENSAVATGLENIWGQQELCRDTGPYMDPDGRRQARGSTRSHAAFLEH